MAAPTEIGKISGYAQKSLVKYGQTVLELHNRMNDLRTKMQWIDIAYARYKILKNNNAPGDDIVEAGQECCGINADDIKVPIVVSQVDSYVGYFAETFLSGYPMFPVVSSPANQVNADKLTAIIDDHATRGRYARHFLKNFRDATKYNITAAEIEWKKMDTYSIASQYDQVLKKKATVEGSSFAINKINHWNMYNTVFDYRVHPADVPYAGEYAGNIQLISRVELKRKLAEYAATTEGYNTAQALTSTFGTQGNASGAATWGGYYKEMPQISNILARPSIMHAGLTDWVEYLTGKSGYSDRLQSCSDMYEYFRLYARIIPAEHGITNCPKPNTPQVWLLDFINHDKLIYAKRIFTIYDILPVIIAQPFEDDFDFQTESIAERGVPFQEASSKLMSIRLNAARRAIMDRAIYDSQMIDQSNVNAKTAAAKIPLKPNASINGKKISDAYYSIPFDSRGTETVMQDMANLGNMADNLNGLNRPNQGQFQKGNKTRFEFETTMDNATNKMRLPALALEMQFFLPIKEQIKMNIVQFGVTGAFQDMKRGNSYNIKAEDITAIKDTINAFEVADGFTPASKLASADVIKEGMQMLSNSPVLQQQLGPMLPGMFIHIMKLGGAKGLEEYLPQQPQQQAPVQQPPAAAPVPGAPSA